MLLDWTSAGWFQQGYLTFVFLFVSNKSSRYHLFGGEFNLSNIVTWLVIHGNAFRAERRRRKGIGKVNLLYKRKGKERKGKERQFSYLTWMDWPGKYISLSKETVRDKGFVPPRKVFSPLSEGFTSLNMGKYEVLRNLRNTLLFTSGSKSGREERTPIWAETWKKGMRLRLWRSMALLKEEQEEGGTW